MTKCPLTHQDINSIVPFDVAVLSHSRSLSRRKTKEETAATNHKHKNDDTKNTTKKDETPKCLNLMCSLPFLIDHLYSNKNDDTSTSTFPPVSYLNQEFDTIYDGISHALLCGDDDDDGEKDNDDSGSGDGDGDGDDMLSKQYDVVSFKFNKHLYHLTVLKHDDKKQSDSSFDKNRPSSFIDTSAFIIH